LTPPAHRQKRTPSPVERASPSQVFRCPSSRLGRCGWPRAHVRPSPTRLGHWCRRYMIFCAGQPSDYCRLRRVSSCRGPVTGCQGLRTPVTDACCHHAQDRVQHPPRGEKILPVSTTGVPDITKEPQAKPEPDQGNGIRCYDRREDPCLHTASWRLEGAFHRTTHKDRKHKRLPCSILSRRPRLSGSQSCCVPGASEGGRAVL
jgi:hypothetical protein